MITGWAIAAGALLIPAAIFTAGRNTKIRPRPQRLVAAAAAAAVLATVTALRLQPLSVSLAFLVALTVAGAAAAVDLTELRLPNTLTYALSVGGIAVLTAITLVEGIGSPLRAIIGGAMYGVWILLGALVKGGYGLGDVKLAVATGIWMGWLSWTALATAVVMSQILITVVLLRFRLRRGDDNQANGAPLGPAIALGFLAGTLAYAL